MAAGTQAFIDIGTIITRRPGVYRGKPCVSGTRMPVRMIVHRVQGGESPEEVADDYDGLRPFEVYAALAYYHANRALLDAEWEVDDAEEDRFEAERRLRHGPSLLERKLG